MRYLVDDLSGIYAPTAGPAAARSRGPRCRADRSVALQPALVRGVDARDSPRRAAGRRGPRHAPAALREANVRLSERLVPGRERRGRSLPVLVSELIRVRQRAQCCPPPSIRLSAPLNPYAASKVAAEAAVPRAGLLTPWWCGPSRCYPARAKRPRDGLSPALDRHLLDARQPLRWYAVRPSVTDLHLMR